MIVKPSHGARILNPLSKGPLTKGGFSPQAEYIFRKQIEEADFVIVNRIDELSAGEVEELVRLLGEHFPGRPVVRMSATTGEGFDGLCEFLDQRGGFGRRLMDVDYDIYAEGEAELGWLNSQLTLSAKSPFDLDQFMLALLQRMQGELALIAAETAHLKIIGLWEGYYGVANLVSSFSGPVLSLPSSCQTRQAQVVVNARVATAPENLTRVVRDCIESEAANIDAVATINTLQSFRPGRPVPTHRISAS